MTDWWRPLRENPRLRLLLAGVIALMLATVVLDLRDVVRARQTEQRRVETTLQRLEALEREADWPQRAAAARAALAAAEAKLWTAPSTAQAQALVQEWLVTTLTAAQLRTVRVAAVAQPLALVEGVGAPASAVGKLPPGTSALRFTVSFELTPAAVGNFASALADAEKWFVLDALSIRRQPLPRMEATLVTLARTGAPAAATAAKSGGGG